MSTVFRLTHAETKLIDIIWENSPIISPELIKIAERELEWKRTTTYTVLKKLCEKGIVQNDNSMVSAVFTRDEFVAGQSRCFVEDTFGGSLPLFLTSFISGRKLTSKQAAELRKLIDEYEEGGNNG